MPSNIEEPLFWAVSDVPDARDWHFNEVYNWELDLPEEVDLDDWDYQNQLRTSFCTIFSLVHGVNILNTIERKKYSLSLEEIPLRDAMTIAREEAMSAGLSETKWWSLQAAIKFIVKRGDISGFTIVQSVLDFKRALAKKQPIFVASQKIDWRQTRNPPFEAVIWKGWPHAFILVWYSDSKKRFKCKNSWGKLWGDQWVFYIKYDDIAALRFSRYAMVDKADAPLIRNVRLWKIWTEYTERWVVNGQRPKDVMTKREFVTVAMRLANKAGFNDDAFELAVQYKFTTPIGADNAINAFDVRKVSYSIAWTELTVPTDRISREEWLAALVKTKFI